MSRPPLKTAAFCAMTCNEVAFHRFLTEEFFHTFGRVDKAEQATDAVKQFCRIESRKELNEAGPAQTAWFLLRDQYKQWMKA